MNAIINFSTAKLLKEKGFDEKCSHYYINDFQNFKHDGKLYKTSLPNDLDNENIFQYVKRTNQPHLCNAPTIAEVVMWLYEKHGIWIYASDNSARLGFMYQIQRLKILGETNFSSDEKFETATKAYSQAIEYTLKNLI